MGTTYEWDFGSGASPGSETGPGPHTIQYTTTGIKTITVTATHQSVTTVEDIQVTISSCPAFIIGSMQDTFERGIGSVNVRLYNDANQDGISDGGSHVMSVNSNSGGSWNMPALTPGTYVIVVTPPTQWDIVDDFNTGDVHVLSNNTNDLPNISGTDFIIPVTLAPNEVDGFFTFVFSRTPGIISGNVEDDLSNPIEGAVINIYADDDEDGVPEGPVLYTTTTDINGDYQINNVLTETPVGFAQGRYVIELEVPTGYQIVSGIDVSNDGDTVVNITTDNLIPCTLGGGEHDAGNNFIIEAI